MKTLKFAVLVLTMLMANSSCTDKGKGEIPPGLATQEEIIEGSEYPNLNFNPFTMYYEHLPWISFQDTSGNDLLEGLEYDTWGSDYGMLVTGGESDYGGVVNSELYTLTYIFEEGIDNPSEPRPDQSGELHVYFYPTLGVNKSWAVVSNNYEDWMSYFFSDGPPAHNYLTFDIRSYKYLPFSDMKSVASFAEKITIRLTCPYLFGDNGAHDIVTWWEPLFGNNTKCFRVEYDGKEFPVEESHFATIILDR